MDLCAHARAAVNACLSARTQDPNLRAAWAALAQGQVARAVDYLQETSESGAVLATGLFERFAVFIGVSDHDVQRLGHALQTRFPDGTQDFQRALARGWIQGWKEAVAGHVSVERILDMAGPAGLLDMIRARIKEGRLADAEVLVTHFPAGELGSKGPRAHALTLVGLAHGPDTKAGKALLSKAIAAAKATPTSHGAWAELGALREVLVSLCQAGLDAADPMVHRAVKTMLRLGQRKKPRGTYPSGPVAACVAAAQRAARDGDDAWLVHIDTLMPAVFTSRGRWQVLLEVALAHRALENLQAEAETLAAIDPKAWMGRSEIRGFYPEKVEHLRNYWLVRDMSVDRSPLDPLRLLVDAGADIRSELDALEPPRGYWGEARLYALLREVAPERAEAMVGELTDQGTAVGLYLYRLASQADRQDVLPTVVMEALELGWLPTSVEIDFMGAPELLEAAEKAAARECDLDRRRSCFTLLAEGWLRHGRWAEASSSIEGALAPPSADEFPEWTPSYLGRTRAGWPPHRAPILAQEPPLEDPFEDALREAEGVERKGLLKTLYGLSQRLTAAEPLRTVRKRMEKAPGGRAAYGSTVKLTYLVEVDLRLGEVDTAIGRLGRMKRTDLSGHGPDYTAETITAWMDRHPATITHSRVQQLLTVLQRAHPQTLPNRLMTMLPVFMAAAEGTHRTMVEQWAEKMRARFTREGDRAFVDLALALGFMRSGSAERAKGCLDRALTGARAPSSYVQPVPFLHAVVQVVAPADRLAFVQRALDVLEATRPLNRFMALGTVEISARLLWAVGDQDVMPALLASGRYSDEIANGLRRTLVVQAVEYAPRPVDAVLAAWSDAPPNIDQAHEQIHCLADALHREGRTDEAAKVRSVLP